MECGRNAKKCEVSFGYAGDFVNVGGPQDAGDLATMAILLVK